LRKYFENTIKSICITAPLDEISKIESFRQIEYLYTNGGFSRVSVKLEKIRVIWGACIDRKVFC